MIVKAVEKILKKVAAVRLKNKSTILAAVLFVLTLFGSALAADKPAAQADVDKLQEQVRTIDKDLAVQKETAVIKLEALEKRQNEITAQQANSLAAISNQTTTVGNYIAISSILVGFLVLVAGSVIYISSASKAREEAREASKRWFHENATTFKNQIEKLRTEVDAASAKIDVQVNQVTSEAEKAKSEIAAKVKSAVSAGPSILNSPTSSDGDGDGLAGAANQEATKIVRDASEALKTKPESEFTANDFYARGLADYADKNYQSALLAFKNAFQALGDDAPAEQKAGCLFAEAVTLGQLDKPEQAIAIYDAIDQRFGKDTAAGVREQVTRALVKKGLTLDQLDKSEQAIALYDDIDLRFGKDTAPGVREQVGRALNGKSFGQIKLAKKQWPDKALREGLLESALTALPRALLQCNEDDRATILGNLGYAQFLSDKRQDAEMSTTECLRLGGENSFDDQLADAKRHRVEPQDSAYEKMLAEIWKNL